MLSEPPNSRRAAARLAAAAVAVPIAAVAFAAPASAAEVPGLDEVHPDWSVPSSITSGEQSGGIFNLDMVPSAGHEDDFHTITFDLQFDDPEGLIDILPGFGCEVDATGTALSCEEEVSGDFYFLDFDLATTADLAVPVPVPYTLAIAVDGIEIASDQGIVDVGGVEGESPYDAYLHGDVALDEAAPGSVVEVTPTFKQDRGFYPGAAAVVVSFSDPYSRIGISQEGAEAIADYDNCAAAAEGSIRGGVNCVITDLTDRTGQALTFTGPVSYAIDDDAIGPFAICECTFNVTTVNAATLESEFGDITWDPASENLLGIRPADSWTEPADPETAAYWGDITITTSDNPLDLDVTDTSFAGSVGDEATATVQVANRGPATIHNRSDGHGSASVRVQLPPGAELAGIDSDGTADWLCLNEESLADEYDRTTTTLDRYDLYCFLTTPLAAGESVDFTFTVSLTGTSYDIGYIEVAALTTGSDGESLESSLDNNVGLIDNLAEALPHSDFTGDGIPDLVAVRKSDGALLLYQGRADGTLSGGASKGTGWAGSDVVMAGDLTGDGLPDLLSRDNATGYLYTHAGDGDGGFGDRVKAGSGWGRMGLFTALDWDGDGLVDLLAVRDSDGGLFYYPGDGDGAFGGSVQVSVGFNWVDMLTSIGDADDDGHDDILVRMGQTQEYWAFLSGSGDPVMYDTALGDPTQDRRYSQLASVGDLDLDGVADLLLVDSRTGALYRQSIGAGALGGFTTLQGSGWGGARLPAATSDRAYDYDQDSANDLIARRSSNDTTYLYFGDGSGGFAGNYSFGTIFEGMNLLETAGDFTGDGKLDVIARVASSGALYVYPGDGVGGFDARLQIGTGWNAMSAIVSGSDFDGDGKVDILAREKSTGYLWMYPGTGAGGVTSRVKIGTGWNAMKEITAMGDLDHDGIADLIAVRASENCMYFYGGKASGGVENGVKMGCGWSAMDAVTAVGDFNGDGHADMVARRKSDGYLYLYKGNGSGLFGSGTRVGTGWNAMDLIA